LSGSHMWISRVSLANLTGLGSRSDWERESTNGWPAPASPNEYVIVWRAEDRSRPAAIVVPTTAEEFFAWSSTYLPHLTPISSVLTVLSAAPASPRKPLPLHASRLGILFGEMAAWNRARVDEDALCAGDFFSTLSFALVQAERASTATAEEIATRWEEARYLLQLPSPTFSVDHLIEVWDTVTEARGNRARQPQDLFAYAEEQVRGPTSNFEGRHFGLHHVDIEMLRAFESGPIEDRIRQFKEFAQQVLTNEKLHNRRTSVLMGAALSRVSGGTFRHAHLLGPTETPDVRPLLWYGYFESLAAVSGGIPWFGGLTGLRLHADIERRSGDSAVDVDIVLDELRVLARGKREVLEMATLRSGSVRVLLAPGVSAEFWRPNSAGRVSRRRL
jgi:hypothetical protein